MKSIIIREATIKDILQMQFIRGSVKENVLSNPELVTVKDYAQLITQKGKGLVALIDGQIQGFAIVDLMKDNIWALFLHPDHEKNGIGKQLHNTILDWYFSTGKKRVWLSTDPETRAEGFYRKLGWKEVGKQPNGEIKFEMSIQAWKEAKNT